MEQNRARLSDGDLSEEQRDCFTTSQKIHRRRSDQDRSNKRACLSKGRTCGNNNRKNDGGCDASIKELCTFSSKNDKNDGKSECERTFKFSVVHDTKNDDGTKQNDTYIKYNRNGPNKLEKSNFDDGYFSKERDIYSRISKIQKYDKWDERNWGKKPVGVRRGAEDHYTFWRNAYDSYIWEIFLKIIKRINKFKKVCPEETDFQEFVDFAYNFSSGYISSYY